MKWISIKDKLPDIEKKQGYECLCYYVNYRTEKRIFRRIGILTYSKGKFHCHYVGGAEKEVTHWMPLPKSPKAKKGK